MLAMFLMIAAQLSKIVCYNPKYPYLITIPTVLLSAGMLFFFTLGSSMVGDICDEDELKRGVRTEGSYYAIFWWFIKLGTALASFVAGALILFTMFDETQVTKVDKFQGNLDEISTWVKNWDNSGKEKKINTQTLQTFQTDALKESNEFQKLLNKEKNKKFENTYKNAPEFTAQREDLINKNLASVQKTIEQLSANTIIADSVLKNKQLIPSPLIQTKLDKLSSSVLELEAYLKDRSLDPKTKNKPHYLELASEIQTVQNSLANFGSNIDVQSLQSNIKAMETKIVVLKRQTPYTLLMMRVVEIGLPILLSILSLIFVFRYTLTEKRTMEIKELLKARNAPAVN